MRALALAALLLASAPAAALDYDEFAKNLQTDEGRAAVRVWLDGFGTAIGMYDVRQALDKKGRRFCTPQGTRLSPELLAGLIEKTVKEQPNLGRPGIPVPAIIWVGLERQYPCKAPVTG